MKDEQPELRTGSRFFENLLASLSDGIMVLDLQGRILYANPALEQICKISFPSIKEKPFEDFSVRNPHLRSLAEKTLQTGAGHHEMDYPFRAADGAVISVFVTTAMISDPAGRPCGMALTFQDIRFFKEMEASLRQSDRLHQLGRLAATMAHEIKNPLGGIKGSAQLLHMEITEARHKKYLDAIVKEVDRINRIVENALDLQRSGEISLSLVNIHKVLNEILILEQRNEKSARVHFRTEFDPSIPAIPADGGRLAQVFLNLIRNGIEAMDGKGELFLSSRISTEYQVVQSEEKRAPSRMLLVEVRDTGQGIPPEARENLFTPFFTTKKQGSGLGLAVCQQIVEKHKGWIKLEDHPTGGTNAKVFLPLK